MKTVEVGNQTCTVQTLREWLESRIEQITRHKIDYPEENYAVKTSGRLAELKIILKKINDRRIQEIG